MAHQAFPKHAEMRPAIGGTPGEICGEPGRSDPICRSVARIADRDFHPTPGSTLPRGTSFAFMSCPSLTYFQRR